MAENSFSTEALDRQHQFEAWRDWFWPVFSVAARDGYRRGYRAKNKVWNLGSIVVSCVSAPGALVIRDASNIRKAPVDHWVLAYCRHGVTRLQTESGLINARPAVPFIWSLAEKSESERTHVDRIQIMIPRDTFHDLSAPLDASRGSLLDNPLGNVLGEYMAALEHWLPSAPEDALPRLGNAVHSMIAACIAPSKDRFAVASDEFARVRAERVRQVVRKHLTSPMLRPDMLCELVGISRSDLYRQFEHAGGVVRYIQRQRLNQAYSMMSDPRSSKSIAAISEQFCFADASSFSRAFKNEFGYSPSDVRAMATDGSPAVSGAHNRQRSETTCFDDLLHNN